MTPSSLRSFFLEGRAGRLEALLNVGTEASTHAGLVCHPHPLFGGTMHNKVVFHTMKAMSSQGWPVLRFNFRGTGLSQSEHDHGRGEVDDVRTALDWLDREFHLPLVFAGFSFGSAIGLQAACEDDRVQALVGLGLPVAPIQSRTYDFSYLKRCRKPKLFVSGSYDQFGSPEQLKSLVESLSDPKQLEIVAGADHFFEGKLSEMREIVTSWLAQTIPA